MFFASPAKKDLWNHSKKNGSRIITTNFLESRFFYRPQTFFADAHQQSIYLENEVYSRSEFFQHLSQQAISEASVLINTFDFLNLLNTYDKFENKKFARQCINMWIDAQKQNRKNFEKNPMWHPQIASIRLINWIVNYEKITFKADESFNLAYEKFLVFHYDFLKKRLSKTSDYFTRNLMMVALIIASCVLPNAKSKLESWMKLYIQNLDDIKHRFFKNDPTLSPIMLIPIFYYVMGVQHVLKRYYAGSLQYFLDFMNELQDTVNFFCLPERSFVDYVANLHSPTCILLQIFRDPAIIESVTDSHAYVKNANNKKNYLDFKCFHLKHAYLYVHQKSNIISDNNKPSAFLHLRGKNALEDIYLQSQPGMKLNVLETGFEFKAEDNFFYAKSSENYQKEQKSFFAKQNSLLHEREYYQDENANILRFRDDFLSINDDKISLNLVLARGWQWFRQNDRIFLRHTMPQKTVYEFVHKFEESISFDYDAYGRHVLSVNIMLESRKRCQFRYGLKF